MITSNIEITEVETKIFEAANGVFLKYGIESATMSQIANEAKISRTSLNYYFRSKKHLVDKVLNNLENKIVPTILHLVSDNSLTVIEKVEAFVDEYLNIISKSPMIPNFIISELSRNPDWIIQIIKQRELDFTKLRKQADLEIKQGLINDFALEELYVNVFGLCVIPIISKPILMEFIFENDQTKFDQFIESRKNQVKLIINSWLKK